MSDPLGRDQYTGHATEGQLRRGRRWATRRDRWKPHTEQDRLNDFEAAEARNEAERERNR